MVGAYFVYEKIANKPTITLSMLVPSNAAMVYEGVQINEKFSKWKGSSIGKSFLSTSFNRNIESIFSGIDTLIAEGLDKSFIDNKAVLISMHIISKEDFDFVYYIKLNEDDGKVLTKLLSTLESQKYSIAERNYEGFKIKEITKGSGLLSFILYEDYFVCSKTAFLIEDVVRTITAENRSGFFQVNNDLTKLPRLQNDEGNLYFNLDQMFKWFGLYTEDLRTFENFKAFGKSSLLDVKITPQGLVLDGFTVSKGKGKDYLNLFDKQEINLLGVKRYIPARAALIAHFGVSDMKLFNDELTLYMKNHYPALLDSARKFSSKYNFDLNRFYNWVGPEVSLCVAELYGSNAQHIVYIKAKEVNEGLNQFNSLADRISLATEDSVFVDVFGEYQIREIGIKDFPQKLFGTFFGGFERTYYTLIDDYFVLSDNLDGLKSLLNDVDSENTWGHSVAWNSFIESTLNESHISVYINTGRAWNIMLPKLKAKWKTFADEYQQEFLTIEKMAIQFNRVDDRYFTNVVLKHNAEASSLIKKNQRLASVRETIFPDEIISNPFVARNHNDNTFEVLVQDSTFMLHLVSAKGDILWKLSLAAPIVSRITQVDYYTNSKLQYFFSTQDGAIHLVDRLGRYIENYPIRNVTNVLEYATVVDYDNSKRYRWLVASEQGDIFMYDKVGTNLDGWKPNRTEGRLSSEARHYRVRGRDYIIALQERGWVYVFNRRGERLRGFPLMLDTRLDSDLYLNPGIDQANTFFTLISKEGILIKFNLNGQVVSREQLYKPSRDALFTMIAERQGKSFIISRQEGGRVALLDENGKEIFQKDYISNAPLIVQYYDFGSGRKIYTVTDKEQELSYVYDQSGVLVNLQPFESVAAPAVTFSENSGKYTLYNIAGKKLQVFTF